MRLIDLRKYIELSPRERALTALKLGAELRKRRRRAAARGFLPPPLRTEKMGIAAPFLHCLHGVAAPVPRIGPGLRETGRLKTLSGIVVDLELTPRARMSQCRNALHPGPKETVEQVAIRQLALNMMDSSSLARLCAAFAYWQATGLVYAVTPILAKGLKSEDEEEFYLAVHCLHRINPRHVRQYVGTAADDRPTPPRRPQGPGAQGPIAASMTVIIHGTFARDFVWYQPGGEFHDYIKRNVYPDVYSDSADLFRWSGRYTHQARLAAARKLVDWCKNHPAQTLRLIAHSNGANVVNLATKLGLQACTLIHLSPPVHNQYLPQMAGLSSQRFFTIRPRIDLVVWLDGGQQDYRGTAVESLERRRICALFGHSTSHSGERWDKKNVPTLVKSVC